MDLYKTRIALNLKSMVLLLVLTFFLQEGYAQLTPAQNQEIDAIFNKWNTPNHPGGAIGIMKDGKLVFSKAYGLASLEYLAPNTPGTLFNVASVSKQFTAMGIVLLHLQGKLSIDDKLKKYVPELPEYAEKITIRHMLHHTSGLRSLHTLLALAGWREDDTRTNEDLYRIMKDQRYLNFEPGSEYMYCNTSFMFMAKIIEEICGENFSQWMKKSIFEPLEMNHTYIEDKYNRVVPNNATSYYTTTNSFDRAIEFWDYVGSGNMHSTTSDLLIWLENFSTPKSQWKEAFKMMLTLDPFNDGTYNDYAFGVRVDSLKGVKRIQHGGSIGGFRSFIGTFPDEKLSIVINTNFSTASPGSKANKIAEILLNNTLETPPTTISNKQNAVKLTKKMMHKYVGKYWDDTHNVLREIDIQNDSLQFIRSNNNKVALIPLKGHTFQLKNTASKIKFELHKKNSNTLKVYDLNSSIPKANYNQFTNLPKSYLQKQMGDYKGEYFSPELKTSYFISTDGERLIAEHIRHGQFDLEMIKKDIFKGNNAFAYVKFQRNKKGDVTGILVSNSRVRNLWFEKRNLL